MNPNNFNFKKTFSVILFVTVSLAMNAQWPQFRGPQRNGYSSEVNLLNEWPEYGPQLVWSTDTIGTGFSSASIADGMVYITGKKDSVEILSALDLTGNLVWQTVFGRSVDSCEWPESRSTPTIFDEHVYAVSLAGDIACLNQKTGKLIWQLPAIDQFGGLTSYPGYTESLLVFDDKVIVSPCGAQTTLLALNRLTGEVIWKSVSVGDTSTHTSPVLIEINGKKQIITTTYHHILAIDPNTGDITTKENIDYPGIVPLPLGNKFYLSGSYNKGGILCTLNNNTMKIIWEDSTHSNYMGGTVLTGNQIFIAGNDYNNRGLACVDAETGKLLSINKEINSANLLATSDYLYCYEERRGRICLLKVNGTGAELVSSFRIKSGGNGPNLAHLSIADGYLYIRHGNSLMVYDIREQKG